MVYYLIKGSAFIKVSSGSDHFNKAALNSRVTYKFFDTELNANIANSNQTWT